MREWTQRRGSGYSGGVGELNWSESLRQRGGWIGRPEAISGAAVSRYAGPRDEPIPRRPSVRAPLRPPGHRRGIAELRKG